MEIEVIIINEESQVPKHKYCMFSVRCGCEILSFIYARKSLVASKGSDTRNVSSKEKKPQCGIKKIRRDKEKTRIGGLKRYWENKIKKEIGEWQLTLKPFLKNSMESTTIRNYLIYMKGF